MTCPGSQDWWDFQPAGLSPRPVFLCSSTSVYRAGFLALEFQALEKPPGAALS